MSRSHASLSLALLFISAGCTLGAEPAGDYPDAIASQEELFMQHIAGKMFLQLPKEHQELIAKAGGIGSHEHNVLDCTHDAPATPDVDPNITAHEYLELIVRISMQREGLTSRSTEGIPEPV